MDSVRSWCQQTGVNAPRTVPSQNMLRLESRIVPDKLSREKGGSTYYIQWFSGVHVATTRGSNWTLGRSVLPLRSYKSLSVKRLSNNHQMPSDPPPPKLVNAAAEAAVAALKSIGVDSYVIGGLACSLYGNTRKANVSR
jgi:hypothetical protein